MKVQEKILTKQSEIWMDSEGILHIHILKDELDLQEVISCFEIYRQLGCEEKKALQIMTSEEIISLTTEAKEYVSYHGKNFFLASAVVSSSLANRLAVNFFNLFYRHEVPFKIFSNEKDALNWLRRFKK